MTAIFTKAPVGRGRSGESLSIEERILPHRFRGFERRHGLAAWRAGATPLQAHDRGARLHFSGAAVDEDGDGYNRGMSVAQRPDVESLPADLDSFLANFFSRRGWHSEIRYDSAENRLYLVVRLASSRLSADDRFFSLVEHFARAQDSLLRQRAGLPLQCRVFATDGSELTGTLHERGSSYLDDSARGAGMRRRLLLLSARRRFLLRVLPGALLWALAFAFLVGVVGLRFDIVVLVSLGALAIQAFVLMLTPGPRR